MLALVKNINLINLAAKNQKLNVQITSNPKVLKVLRVLTNYNLIEYEILSSYVVNITLKYKNQSPCLKSIRFMGGNHKNNVSYTYSKRELSNKRALYIIQTSNGLLSLDAANKLGKGGIILFKINI